LLFFSKNEKIENSSLIFIFTECKNSENMTQNDWIMVAREIDSASIMNDGPDFGVALGGCVDHKCNTKGRIKIIENYQVIDLNNAILSVNEDFYDNKMVFEPEPESEEDIRIKNAQLIMSSDFNISLEIQRNKERWISKNYTSLAHDTADIVVAAGKRTSELASSIISTVSWLSYWK